MTTPATMPAIGDQVQRLDDGRIGRVLYIDEPGPSLHPGSAFMRPGDVEVEYGPGRSTVTSCGNGGAFFWTKFRRVDEALFAELAALALRESFAAIAEEWSAL